LDKKEFVNLSDWSAKDRTRVNSGGPQAAKTHIEALQFPVNTSELPTSSRKLKRFKKGTGPGEKNN
jgi:hypothetical protein